MSWPADYPPITASTAFTSWMYLKVIDDAILERVRALGTAYWPPGVIPWDSGTVTSITATTMRDNTKVWATSPKRWVGYIGADYVPANYDVVIGDDTDPNFEVIRVRITDHTADTLTIDDITNWVTSNYVASLSALVGKKYYIVRRDGTYYPFWHQRRLRRPNDHSIWKGTISSATTSSVTVTGATWTVNQFAGKAFFGFNGSNIVRVSITSNTADTLSWSTQSWTPSGEFEIQESTSSVCWPSTLGEQATAWYRGYQDQVYTHYPDDSVGTAKNPATQIEYQEFNGIVCDTATSSNVYDVDFHVAFDDGCNDTDKWFAKDMFKTPRGRQLWAEGASLLFVDPTATYEGSTYIGNMVPAVWFNAAGINTLGPFSGTTDGSGDVTFTISGLPSVLAEDYYYAAVKGDTSVAAYGRDDSGSLILTGLEPDTAYTLYVSLGWTRIFPRMFRYMFDKTYFEPDSDGMGGVVDPPTSADPGAWVTIPASTKYLEYHAGFGLELVEAESFTNGDKARYVGDRWHDLGIAGTPGGTTADPVDTYRTYGATRQHPPTQHAFLQSQLTGTTTGGAATYLITASQNWYTNNWYSGGVMYTHTGTATGGSTTTLIDTTKAGDGRWAAGTGRFVGHCVRVEVSSGVWEQRICTAYNAATQTLTVSPAFSVSASGKSYEIPEPKYELNRYKGRQLMIIDPSGPTTYTTVITASTDTHLFFTTIGTAVGSGWTFTIDEPPLGAVYDRTLGKWVSSDHPFTDEADPVTRYGHYTLNDYVGPHLIEELIDGLNKLRWIQLDFGWRSRAVDATPEDNYQQQSGNYYAFIPADWAPSFAAAEADYAGATPIEADNLPPYVTSQGTIDPALGAPFQIQRQYAYGSVNPPNILSSSVDWYVKTFYPVVSPPSLSDFDANGDDVVEGVFHNFDSDGASNTANRRSDRLGSLATPNRPTVPPAPTIGNSTNSSLGWQVSDQRAIIKFDVAGGLVYVD